MEVEHVLQESTAMWYQNVTLEHAENYISENLRAAARNVIAIGYYLKCIRDGRLYENAGYQSIWEYAKEKFGFSMSTASRYMSRNDKFSKDGNSPILDERYHEYNKSQLQEMLSLNEEQLEQVTPDMTAREIRDMRKPKEIPYYDIPGQEEMLDIPGVVLEEESVATSQKNPEQDDCLESGAESGQQEDPDAAEMQENEEIRCKNSSELEWTMEESEELETEEIIDAEFEEEEESVSDLALLKDLLNGKKSLLESNLKIPGIEPDDIHIRRQKMEVAALTSMLCELEDVEEEAEETEPPEQPDLPVMMNNNARREFIDSYQSWPLWLEQKETGERYYRYELPEAAMVVKVYFCKCFDYYATKPSWEARFKDGWGDEEYYLLEGGKYFKDCRVNRSILVDYLKELQKEGK